MIDPTRMSSADMADWQTAATAVDAARSLEREGKTHLIRDIDRMADDDIATAMAAIDDELSRRNDNVVGIFVAHHLEQAEAKDAAGRDMDRDERFRRAVASLVKLLANCQDPPASIVRGLVKSINDAQPE